MDWIVTTARTVEEAQSRALDLLGVDGSDAEIQVIEEGKTGLFGRTKSEARIRARIKPKAPPAKDDHRRGEGRKRNRGAGGDAKKRARPQGGDAKKRARPQGGDKRGEESQRSTGGRARPSATGDKNRPAKGNRGRSGSNDRSRSGGGSGGGRGAEDRVEMPVEEQRETLEKFVTGVAAAFDSDSSVVLVEEGTTLQAQVEGGDLGRLIGNKASTLQALEELARTAMHRAAAGRRYHRIQVDVDGYKARRREALARFAVQTAEAVAAAGESKAMEPMGAADRKLIHDAVADVVGVETVSEGRDPRRYIVLLPTAVADEEE